MHNHFGFEIDAGEQRLLVRLRGELDLTASDSLVAECGAAMPGAPRTVVLDLRELEFMDSTGLRALLALRDRADDLGHRFIVVKGNRQVQRLLDLTKVSEHLTVVDDPDEAPAD